MLRAVLDANVYVSAVVRPEGPPGRILERFLGAAAFTVVLSPAIVEEVLRALEYPKVRQYVRRDLDPAPWFEDIVLLAEVVPGAHQLSRVSKDPDDDKYIAAAVEGRAAFVVTGDPHLLAVSEYEGVRIMSPRAFLDLLGP